MFNVPVKQADGGASEPLAHAGHWCPPEKPGANGTREQDADIHEVIKTFQESGGVREKMDFIQNEMERWSSEGPSVNSQGAFS